MRLLVVLVLLFVSVQSRAQHEAFHAYVAAGITFTPNTFRVGSEDWEGGLITNKRLGFGKIFDFGTRYYSSFGFVYTGDLGVYSAMGLKAHLWIIPMRFELIGYTDTKAAGFANALIGFTYGF